MRKNPAFLAAVFFTILAIALFTMVAIQEEFPVFHQTNQTSSSFVNVNGEVGAEDSRFMWNNDSLALIAQAFVLFAAAAATLGLLKNRGDDKHA
jgi:hypothetical protein